MPVSKTPTGERGAVIVIVAVMLPLLALLISFGIDTANWWVHDRHLQTQADAAALAGGIGPWLPTCDEAAIENAARQYAGDPSKGPLYNGQYPNSGNISVLLNAKSFTDVDFSDGGTPCQNMANGHGFLDVKVTESNLANYFSSIPGFGSVTIKTHARVAIQQALSEEGFRPIAVRDDAAYKCARVDFYNASSNAFVTGFTLGVRTTLSDGSTQFSNTSAGNPVAMPASAPLYMQTTLSDCQGASDTFPQDSTGAPAAGVGVSYINNFDASAPAPTPGGTPKLGSVVLQNASCAPDQYFIASLTTCGVTAKAYVQFASGAVTAPPGQNAFVTINGANATSGSDAGGTFWTAPLSVAAGSGPTNVTVNWEEQYPVPPCKTNNSNPCKGTFGVKQAYFAATDDDSVTNSGKLKLVEIGEAGQSVLGANSFAGGTTHSLVVTIQTAGLSYAAWNAPAVVIRNANQSSKRTGLVDCGQGNGASADYNAIVYGCPRSVAIWEIGDPCMTPSNSNAPTPINCVQAIFGNRRKQIARAIEDRIGNGCNYWQTTQGFTLSAVNPGDPRLIPVIVTGPADLSGGSNGTPIPVLNLATFYVTGYDGGQGQPSGCLSSQQNEPFPGPGTNDKFAVWGHWVKYGRPGAGSGISCNPSIFGDCVATLTQ